MSRNEEGEYKMGKTAKIFMVFAIIATIAFGAWATVRIVKAVDFDMNCKQYLKRAADANTVETAKEELGKAISYAETHNLTQGVVSILFHQPKNDIGYWYKNMTNILMKLRETLTDESESGVSVTIPDGISVFPNNVMYFWWGLLSSILCVIFWILVLCSLE